MSNQTQDLGPKNIIQAIEGMTLSLNPEEAKDLAAVIQFKVTPSTSPSGIGTSGEAGEASGGYYLTIAEGKCDFSVGLAAEPSLTINTPADVWLKIARKEMNGAMALMTGKYTARGQLSLLMKMDKLFSRQPTQEELVEKGWL